MINTSMCQPGNPVTFPQWKGEKHYMLPFTVARGLPVEVARYADTVSQMMSSVRVHPNQECYLMIDEADVKPDAFHRRPGLHVDGHWHPGVSCHGPQPEPGHRPYWSPPSRPAHGPVPAHGAPSGQREALLLASNYSACRALVGEYERDFLSDWRGGDCSSVDITEMSSVLMQANRVYKLDVMSVHESLPIRQAVRRSVVRINVPGGIYEN